MKHKKSLRIYERYIKRLQDFVIAMIAFIILVPVTLTVAFIVRVKLGSPVIFKQIRPGLNEKLFKLYKFRSMTDATDSNGELLSDEKRLTEFGQWLRSSSLDELISLINVITGKMSLCGPRPLLVRDMVFMTEEQHRRHRVRPGITGLAQINGRNDIDWEDKLKYDIQYVDNITFLNDWKILFSTIRKVFIREGITEQGMATALDFGDYLLLKEKVTKDQYDIKQKEAKTIIENTMRRM